jgi:hypothetical protein
MNKKQRTEKLRDMKNNIYGKVFAEEIDEKIKEIRADTIDSADEIAEVHGAKIAIKYLNKLKRRIQRQTQKGDKEDAGPPSWE